MHECPSETHFFVVDPILDALGEGADKVAQGVVDAAKQAQGEALVKMKAIMQDMQKDIAKTLQADMK